MCSGQSCSERFGCEARHAYPFGVPPSGDSGLARAKRPGIRLRSSRHACARRPPARPGWRCRRQQAGLRARKPRFRRQRCRNREKGVRTVGWVEARNPANRRHRWVSAELQPSLRADLGSHARHHRHRRRECRITAFRDLENTQVAGQKSLARQHAQQARVDSVKNYVRLSRLQFDEGYAPYLVVLDSLRQIYDAEIDLILARNDTFVAAIQLYRAMGGRLGLERAAQARSPLAGLRKETQRIAGIAGFPLRCNPAYGLDWAGELQGDWATGERA